MTVFHALVLGIVQGITEFLPISSSGHLIIVPALFGWEPHGMAFDVMVHMGTLLAVCIYFAKDIWKIILGIFGKGDAVLAQRRLAFLLFIATIPAVVVGLFFKDAIEAYARSTVVVGIGLIVWGIVLYFADRYAQKKQNAKISEKMSVSESLVIGAAQALALIPGTSRSGITVSAGLWSGLTREEAIRFSFLMSIPVIGGAGLLTAKDLIETGTDISWGVLLVGMVSSCIGGLVAIVSLLKIVQKWSFTPFVTYRILMGVGLIIFWLMQ